MSLRPSTGGIFIVILETLNEQSILESHVIWDRKCDGGFPETKELKVLPPFLFSLDYYIDAYVCRIIVEESP